MAKRKVKSQVDVKPMMSAEARLSGTALGLLKSSDFNLIEHNKLVLKGWTTIRTQLEGLTPQQHKKLLNVFADNARSPREVAKAFASMVGEVWDGAMCEFTGTPILRALLTMADIFDDEHRPMPRVIAMGEIDGCNVVYYTADAQFEVISTHRRKRFPALYLPIRGMDLDDMRVATDIIRTWREARLAPSVGVSLDAKPAPKTAFVQRPSVS